MDYPTDKNRGVTDPGVLVSAQNEPMSGLLTDRQERERAEYAVRAARIVRPEIDFEYYSQKRFGPWNPYWRVYDRARCACLGGASRVLSYGCGAGRTALIFARMGYEVSGFDLSDPLIEAARAAAERYGLSQRTSFSVQAAENLEYPENAFDVVIGEDILHHVDLPKALPELCRVLKPGGVAVFKDSLSTPFRDKLRRNPPVTWVLPIGIKNRMTGELYYDTLDERPLNNDDLALMRQMFLKVEVEKFHVLTLLAKIFGNRPFFERCDWRMFKLLPVLRRLGDNIVVVLEKEGSAGINR